MKAWAWLGIAAALGMGCAEVELTGDDGPIAGAAGTAGGPGVDAGGAGGSAGGTGGSPSGGDAGHVHSGGASGGSGAPSGGSAGVGGSGGTPSGGTPGTGGTVGTGGTPSGGTGGGTGGTPSGGTGGGTGPSCSDNVKNGTETDVDCGGTCPKCANGKACTQNGDCTSAQCAGNSCAWVVIVAPNGDNSFQPASLTIPVGGTVRWVWQEKGHTVTGGTGCGDYAPGWCSPTNSSCQNAPTSDVGATYDRKFTAAGSNPYYCRPHCGMMKGTITVQ
ncbi:MAG: plastocyanin/azurin family copper-binding protein [Polyangiaceae bacterium]